jgi:hypothetical protein
MTKLPKYGIIAILITSLLFPSSAFATSNYSNNDFEIDKSFFSFLLSFSKSKEGNDWYQDHLDKQWGNDDLNDWDGCFRDNSNSSRCIESKDVWHDWYCWKKDDHNHIKEDDYLGYWDDDKEYSWGDFSFLKWW